MSLCVICGGRHFESECPTEWMPVNPCTPKCRQRDNYCPPKNRFGCEDYHVYKGEVEAQRKLLEYLIADAKNINDHNLYPIIGKVQLESMLKQLEGKG